MTDYLDFKVIFAPGFGNTYRMTGESRGGAKTHGIFVIPEKLQRSGGESRPDSRNIQVVGEPAPDALLLTDRERGELLFKAMFQDNDVGKLLEQCRTEPIRLKLVFESPRKEADGHRMTALHDLPWELLYDHDFLALDSHYSLVRNVDGRAPRLGKLPLRLKALMLAANPGDTRELDLQREAEGIKRAVFLPRIKLHFLEGASHRDLYQGTEKGFHVLHFMGHGECDESEAAIYLQDARGNSQKLTAQSFVRVILGMKDEHKPQLIVLNACEGSAAVAGRHGLEGMAANLVREGVPAVVAMREEISDKAAIAFSGAFYRRLARAETVDEAVLSGRQAIATSQSPEDWSLPVLYSNLPGGRMTRRLRPLRTLLPVAALLLLWWCWHGLRHQVILTDPSWAEEVMGESYENQYYALLEARGLKVGAYPIGRELRLVAHETEIIGNMRYRFFFLAGSTRSFSVARNRNGPEPQGDQATLAMVQRLAWRTLNSLGREAKDLEAGSQGLGFLEVGDLEAAEERFRQALEHNPDFAEAHNNLAVLLWAQVRFDEALAHARAAWKTAPGVAAYAYNLGRILIDKGDTSAAAELLEQYAWKSGHTGVLNELGKLLTREKRWGEAMLAFGKCLEVDPRFSAARKNLAGLHLDRGRADLAEPLLRTVLDDAGEDSSTNNEALALQVRCFARLNRPREACAAWNALVKGSGNGHESSRSEAFEIAHSLGCVTPQYQPRPKTLAFLLSCQGPVTLHTPGKGNFPAWPRNLISQGQELRVGSHAKATLVTPEDRILHLDGETTWQGGDVSTPVPGSKVEGFFATVTSGLNTAPSALGRVLMTASKGDDALTILAPRGMARTQGEIAWTPVEGTDIYRITVAEEFGMLESLEIQAKPHSNGICRISWPWPDWRPSPRTRLSIVVTAIGPDGNRESGVDVTVLEKEREAHLREALRALADTSMDEAGLTHARAELLRHFGLAGARILERSCGDRPDREPESVLALCEALIEGGLPKRAIARLTSFPEDRFTAPQRARAEELWGSALTLSGDREAAAEHLARARSLFKLMGEPDRKEAQVL